GGGSGGGSHDGTYTGALVADVFVPGYEGYAETCTGDLSLVVSGGAVSAEGSCVLSGVYSWLGDQPLNLVGDVSGDEASGAFEIKLADSPVDGEWSGVFGSDNMVGEVEAAGVVDLYGYVLDLEIVGDFQVAR
ncbi:MAG: hypothetical protein D6798_10345, partial [Deltaproteobacteria bacterium]